MPFKLDPEIAEALGAMFGGQPPPPPPPVGDVQTRRERFGAFMDAAAANIPEITEVKSEDFHTTTSDGHSLLLRWFTPVSHPAPSPTTPPSSAILYIHGGGMIAFTLQHYHKALQRLVLATGIPILAVDYRLAPEFPAPIPVTDSYAGLSHLHAHASELGIDRSRIGVMGDSAGGGIAASLAHYVKLRGGPAIARQVLVYPMLDDRGTRGGEDPHVAPFAFWSHVDNQTGWRALLGEARAGAEEGVGPTDAAGRMTVEEARGLPPAYIDVGELDIFRDECLEYARKLGAAGVECEFHLYPGAPHAFEAVAPTSRVAGFALEQRLRVLKSI